MPKRPSTPPPSNDEPKYLTVCSPYPLHANWERIADTIDFSRWIACSIGTKPFYAFYYKPKARGMVILEVERSFDGFDKLLGEHRWNEFLRNPEEEEKGRVSQIFYCTYPSNRDVQKDGWKRIDVEESWFKGWSPMNKFSYPYPATHWCPIPPEDKTNKPLCRPIPSRNAPLPPPSLRAVAPPPVVGSSTWVNAKAADHPSLLLSSNQQQQQQQPRGARGRGAGAPAALTIHTRSSIPAASSSASASAHKSPSSAWNKGAPSSGSATTPLSCAWSPRSDVSSPASSVPNQSACPPGIGIGIGIVSVQPGPTPSQQPQPPPAAPPPVRRRWADDTDDDADSTWWNEPPLLPASAGPSTTTTTPARRGDGDDAGDEAKDPFDPELAEAIENMAVDDTLDPALTYVTQWEQERVERARWAGAVEQSFRGPAAARVEVSDSLWDDEPAAPAVPAQAVCSAHGVACKKGICQDYARQVREGKREEERRRREAAISEKMSKRRRRRTGDGTDGTVCGSASVRSTVDANSSYKYGVDDSVADVVGSWRRDDHGQETRSPADEEDGGGSPFGRSLKGKGRSRGYSGTESVAANSDRWGPGPSRPR